MIAHLLQEYVTPVATFLGYMFLSAWVLLMTWFATALSRELRYDRLKKRRDEAEWDHVRSQWLTENRRIFPNFEHDTDAFDYPAEAIYDWDKHHDFA